MNGFLYGVALQWKLDIRSKSLLVTCYIVPLIFFLLMGGIFTSVMPEMRNTLIQSMIVMSVSMGGVYRASAIIGRNVWKRCEKGLSSKWHPVIFRACNHVPFCICASDDQLHHHRTACSDTV